MTSRPAFPGAGQVAHQLTTTVRSPAAVATSQNVLTRRSLPLAIAGRREPQEIRDRANRPPDAGPLSGREAALNPRDPPRLETVDGVDLRRLAGGDRGPRPGRIAGVANVDDRGRAAEQRGERRYTARLGQPSRDAWIESVDGNQAHPHSARHDGQRGWLPRLTFRSRRQAEEQQRAGKRQDPGGREHEPGGSRDAVFRLPAGAVLTATASVVTVTR